MILTLEGIALVVYLTIARRFARKHAGPKQDDGRVAGLASNVLPGEPYFDDRTMILYQMIPVVLAVAFAAGYIQASGEPLALANFAIMVGFVVVQSPTTKRMDRWVRRLFRARSATAPPPELWVWGGGLASPAGKGGQE